MMIALILMYAKRKQIKEQYVLYVVFMVLAFLSESTLQSLVLAGYTTAVVSNIYVLFEFITLLGLFYQWSSKRNLAVFYAILASGVVIWVVDNFFFSTIRITNSYFRIYYAAVLILCSINQLNKVIFSETGNLFLNAQFLICITFIIYYSYRVFIETLFIFQFSMSNGFLEDVFMIMKIVNFFSHLILTLAVLCIPAKQEFTSRF